jgi:hypothetical protein
MQERECFLASGSSRAAWSEEIFFQGEIGFHPYGLRPRAAVFPLRSGGGSCPAIAERIRSIVFLPQDEAGL